MKGNSLDTQLGVDASLGETRKELVHRLDDLRGLGLLPAWSDAIHLSGEESLQKLALSLADLLENSQRRVIETSIQLLSLRELVAGLLNLRTPEEVAQTVTLYLSKAFDHERVLMGIYDAEKESLEGWVAVNNGESSCRPFHADGTWSGGLRDAAETRVPVRAGSQSPRRPFLDVDGSEESLWPFHEDQLGSYIVYPLLGQGGTKTVGVLAVARSKYGPPLEGMDEEILESLVEAVATALENVLLEADVRREEAFRKDIMGSMDSGLVAVNLEGRVLTMNEGGEALTGFRREDVQGEDTSFLDPSGHGITSVIQATLESRRGVLRTECPVRRDDGTDFPAACTTTLLRNPRSEEYGVIATFDDLTEIKDMEERIRQLDRLAALGRFAAGLAHEIRNPLAGIAAGVQYLERHLGKDPEQLQNIRFITKEIDRLNGIVEDLFQVTHPHPPRRTPEQPHRLVELSIRCLGDFPSDRQVSVANEVPEDLPEVLMDPDQIQQVLINLLKNAIEATSAGGAVMVRAHVVEHAGRTCLDLEVLDTGPGIDPEVLPHVCEPFFTKGKAEGTGLGLYVSHGIAERHGGEVLAANRAEGGAVFTLMLPLTSLPTSEMNA